MRDRDVEVVRKVEELIETRETKILFSEKRAPILVINEVDDLENRLKKTRKKKSQKGNARFQQAQWGV